MEPLLEASAIQIKELAAKGLLTWQGKKIVFDPFLSLDLIIEIETQSSSLFVLHRKVVVGAREEDVSKFDLVCPLGALQGGVFRLWKESRFFKLIQQMKTELSAKELDALLLQEPPFRWKGEAVQLKPAPLPILQLTDRTGAFAKLRFDYGAWGESGLQGSPEEKYWETDLLETGFKRKPLGVSDYFCPLDVVGKSIAFLLDMGWKVIDFQGKRVVRQAGIDCQTEERQGAILLRGTVAFGETHVPIQDVVGSFERHERWIDLSPDKVGLIELPPTWESVLEEERSTQGIHVKKMHAGLLTGLAALPPTYQPAEWEQAPPTEAFQGTLFSYQQKGVNWLSFLSRAGFCGLLADEMGLGKTIQVLAFLTHQAGRALIVMPVTLLSLWKEQIKQFLPETPVYVHQGPKRRQTIEELEEHSLILTSYATLRQDAHLFMRVEFETIVLDEAQMIKNGATQIAQSVYRLKGLFRVALTGTPIENRVEELVSIFHFLMPTLDATNSKKIKPFILRRTKKEVGLDLPEKIIQTVGIEPSEEEFSLYENLLRTKRAALLEKIAEEGCSCKTTVLQKTDDFASSSRRADETMPGRAGEGARCEELAKGRFSGVHEFCNCIQGVPASRMQVLELILRLRQHCCHPQLLDPTYTGECQKFARVLADLEEVLASGQKVLVYSQFTSMLKLFEKEFKERGWKYAYLDGTAQNREAPVFQFQNDPETLIFLISLKAGGVGLNLQAADYVFLYDPWWNSAAEHQAIDRAHRIGRRETVIARKYFTIQSIEAKILDLQVKKEALAQSLWDDGVAVETLSFNEIQELLGL